jgi:hypothetical protein
MCKRRRAAVQPRIVRFLDAPSYVGMDRGQYKLEVRPQLTEATFH